MSAVNPQAIAFFNKLRVAFMERASAPTVPPHALKLAYLIAFKYMNRKTMTARPAQETLARDLNVSVRTVQRLLDILEPLGLVIVPGDGRGLASTYCIDPERVTRVSSFSAQKGDKKGRQKPPKRVTPVSPQPRKNQNTGEGVLRTPLSRERETFACANDFPNGGDPPADAGPRQERPPAQQSPLEAESLTARSSLADGKERFSELRAVWARPWADDDAADQRAFEAACREVAPKAIIAAAAAHVAAADAPRFLPPLAKWLASRGWEKPPPTKKGSNGAARRPGRKANLADIGAELVRKYAAERAAS